MVKPMPTSPLIPAVSALHHVALPVADLERARRFYRDTLGLREIDRPSAFDFPGAWFALGDGQLHLIERADGTRRGARPLDSRDVHFAVRVGDFDAMLAHLRSAGYRDDVPMDDPRRMKWSRTPSAGFPQIFVMDPDRHVIEINSAPA
jgi:catechol 2,3-dioxygenase-like lactoylglutathione lyase family enzyme